jgi:hypothetical protein
VHDELARVDGLPLGQHGVGDDGGIGGRAVHRLLECLRRVRAGRGGAAVHVDELVPDDLTRRQRLAERLALLRVLRGQG